MQLARGILAGLIFLGLSGLVQAQSLTANPASSDAQQSNASKKDHPNILFIVMDDVGIDQMSIFGYGGGTAPLTPNIDTVARAGVLFRNVWSMPECSPSRAIFFEGRYPLRTHINSAILSDDLANSQTSPYEVTTPEILKNAGYMNALFGKFHLAGPDHNPYGRSTPHALGWDYFDGFLEGAPYPIDTSIGNQFTDMTSPNVPQSNAFWYTCGFVPNKLQSPLHGADTGACYLANSTCSVISKDATQTTPGFSCLESGGIFVPNQVCVSPAPALDFTKPNAYYAWKRLIIDEQGNLNPANDNNLPLARGYVSDQTTQSAVDWIRQQNANGQSWMATVAYANDHSPYQQPPVNLIPPSSPDALGLSCTGNSLVNVPALRILSNLMIEAMDNEIGTLLVQSGLATRDSAGNLQYDPTKNNTMVVIIGDNGTYAPGVKLPFDLQRAKGYVYQTGVWVPLIVAGPLVASPGREVTSMVNIADLFQLWGEFAGVDVHKVVPKSHFLDSQSMLPYLTKVKQKSIRQTNFTQTASNFHDPNEFPSPCVLTITPTPTCVQLFNTRQLCNFEGGQWYGPGDPVNAEYNTCCDVQRANIYSGLNQLPVDQTATRNDQFKLVRKTVTVCGQDDSSDTTTVQTELYPINEDPTNPEIDKAEFNLCPGEDCASELTGPNLATYNALANSMTATLMSEPQCPGDGNEDKLVNNTDVKNWSIFDGQGSSWYDFNMDGATDNKDLTQYILPNLGKNCLKKNNNGNNNGNGNGNNSGNGNGHGNNK